MKEYKRGYYLVRIENEFYSLTDGVKWQEEMINFITSIDGSNRLLDNIVACQFKSMDLVEGWKFYFLCYMPYHAFNEFCEKNKVTPIPTYDRYIVLL